MAGNAFEYINRTYGLSVRKGLRVRYLCNTPRLGTVTGADGHYVLIRLDGERQSRPYHPTSELEYLPNEPMAAPRVKLTSATRRGLALVHRIATEAEDDSKPPAATTIAKWNKREQKDYRQALAWIAQERPR